MKNFDRENIIKANPKLSIRYENFISILILISIENNHINSLEAEYYEKILNIFQRIAYSEKLKKLVMNTGKSK